MRGDMFVFDNVVHAFDLTEENVAGSRVSSGYDHAVLVERLAGSYGSKINPANPNEYRYRGKWERMRVEFPECQVCERTIRLYVRKRKIALGLMVHETFVPQSYEWGVREAEPRNQGKAVA